MEYGEHTHLTTLLMVPYIADNYVLKIIRNIRYSVYCIIPGTELYYVCNQG